jgi:glycosyltransferase involved in cell wall biosynthesis
LRIAYIADAEIPAATANSVQILQMCAAMAGLGHEVTLWGPSHPRRAASAGSVAALRSDFALPATFRLRYLPRLTIGGRLGGLFHPEAVLAARFAGCDLAFTRNPRVAAWACRLGIRAVLESHSLNNSARQDAACRYLGSSPHLARWVFISDRLRELFAQRFSLPTARCHVDHDAVDLPRFEPELSREAARRQLSLDPTRPLVVHSGQLYVGRGGEVLLAAAATLPHVYFLFIGGRPDDILRCRATASLRGLTNVDFVGHKRLPDLPPYLFAADVLAMPYTAGAVTVDGRTKTIEYASPMKLFEYMAAGRAIVASRFPSTAEVLRDGENALLVEPDSPEALSGAIARLLADPALPHALGTRARRDVVTHAWPARAARVLAGLTLASQRN